MIIETRNFPALSIGDWVQDANGIYAQILGIENWSDGYMLNIRINGVNVGCVPASSAHYIPITPEILEKNGFRKSKRFSKDWQLTRYNDEVYINLGDRYTSCEHSRMVHNPEDVSEVDYSNSLEMPRPMFVHELQRFLQLANVDKEIEL